MALALYGLGFFTACFLLHVLLWKLWLPRRQLPTLLALLLVVFPALLLGLTFAVPQLRDVAPADAPGWVTVGLFHLAFSLGYGVTYTALEEDSPSLCLLRYVARAGDAGRSTAETKAFLLQGNMVGKRLEAAQTGDLLVEREGRYHLTPRGERLAAGFLLAQRLLGLPTGG